MASASRFFAQKKALVAVLALVFMAILSHEANAATPSPMSLLLEPNMTGAPTHHRRHAARRTHVSSHLVKRQDNSQDTDVSRADGTQDYNNSTEPGVNPSPNSTAAPLTGNGTAIAEQHAMRQIYHELESMINSNHTSSPKAGSVIVANIDGKTVSLPSSSSDTLLSGKDIKKAAISRSRFCATPYKRPSSVDELSQKLQMAQMTKYENMAQNILANALLDSNQTAATAAAASANGTNATVQDPDSQTSPTNGSLTPLANTTINFATTRNLQTALGSQAAEKKIVAYASKSNISSVDYRRKLSSSASLVIQELIAAQEKEIPVYFHVVHSGKYGKLSRHRVNSQMRALNRGFKMTGYQFRLQNVTYTDKKRWFHDVAQGNALDTTMKNALHAGNASALNIYSVDLPDEQIGYSTYPWEAKKSGKKDGVVIAHSTVPEGALKGYNLGKTALHEVGHWLGLLHVFDGGCSGYGDGVRDTPASSGATADGCVAKKNTCKNRQGLDAVHNYMDWSSDACSTQFTQGQIVRMHALGEHYRNL